MSKPRNNLIGHTIFLTSEKYRMLPVIGHTMFFTSEKSDIAFSRLSARLPKVGIRAEIGWAVKRAGPSEKV